MVLPQMLSSRQPDGLCNLANLAVFKTKPTIPRDWVQRQDHAAGGMTNCKCYTFVSGASKRRAGGDTSYSDVTKDVLRSTKVTEAVLQAARDDYDHIVDVYGKTDETKTMSVLRDKHQRRAASILHNMKTVISRSLVRIACWLLFKLLGRMLTSIQFNKEQLAAIRRVQQNAQHARAPVIYLPLHRSHLDYILVSFILYMNNIKLPLVAAGDNLNIPFFGSLMRGLGAFFIKRKLDPSTGQRDHVYRAVLAAYVAQNMQRGESLEFFLEGGRSRSGKACMPKGGLLSIVVNTLVDNQVENAFIVPVAISYEKLIDGNFVAEQLGKPKVNESFTLAVKAIWKTLRSKFGSVRVDFGTPFALKEYLHNTNSLPIDAPVLREGHYHHHHHCAHGDDCSLKAPCSVCSPTVSKMRTISSSASLYGTDVIGEPDRRRIIQALGEHVVFDASNSAALMSTQLLPFLLLTQFRKGATLQQLVPKMDWLRDELHRRNRIMGFSGDTADVIRYAANLLGRNLVSTEIMEMAFVSTSDLSDVSNGSSRVKKIISLRPSNKLHSLLELQYYSNSVVPAFLVDSIIGKWSCCPRLAATITICALFAANSLFAILGVDLFGDAHTAGQLRVYRDKIVDVAMELCNLMKYEFIIAPVREHVHRACCVTPDLPSALLQPCAEILMLINDSIDHFLQCGILTTSSVTTAQTRVYVLDSQRCFMRSRRARRTRRKRCRSTSTTTTMAIRRRHRCTRLI